MSEFTSAFMHPTKGAFFFPMHGQSLEQEIALAKRHDSESWGKHLYSRPVRQVLMRTGERYKISFYDPALFVRYRKHDEALHGSFDYYRIGGSHDSQVIFHVNHSVFIPECGFNVDVRIALRFEGPRSFKFRDLCKENLAAIEFRDGIAVMRFYKSAHTGFVEFEALLHIMPPNEVTGGRRENESISENGMTARQFILYYARRHFTLIRVFHARPEHSIPHRHHCR